MTASLLARATSAALIGGVCLLVAGCGGSGRLTHGELKSKATAICKHANGQLEKLSRANSFAEVVTFVDQLTRIAGDELNGLKKLKPPKADESKFDALLNDFRSGIARLADLKAAAQARDRARARSVLQEIASNPLGKDSRALGLAECARSPSPRT